MTYLTIFYWIVAFFVGIAGIKSEWKSCREEGLKKPIAETVGIIVTMAIIFYLTKDNVF